MPVARTRTPRKPSRPWTTSLRTRRKHFEEAQKKGQSDKVKQLSAEVADLQKPWQLAKDRFDLDLRERKAVQERIVHPRNHDQARPGPPGRAPGQQDRDKAGTESSGREVPRGGSRWACDPDGAPASEPTTGVTTPAPTAAPRPAAPLVPGLPGMPHAPNNKPGTACADKDRWRNSRPGCSSTPSRELVKAEEAGQEEGRGGQQERTTVGVAGGTAPERRPLHQARARASRYRPVAGEERAAEPGPLQPPGKREGQQRSRPRGAGARSASRSRSRMLRLQAALKEIKEREDRLAGLREERDLVVDASARVSEATKSAKAEI